MLQLMYNTISFYTSDGLVIDLTGDKNNSNIKTINAIINLYIGIDVK